MVLHLQHPGSDAEVLRRGGLAGLRAAGNGQQLIARAADVRAVLDGAGRRQRDGDTRWASVRLDADPFGGHQTGEPRARVYEGLPHGQRAFLWLDGADHGSFGGSRELGRSGRRILNRAQSALALEDTHRTLVTRLSTLWWRQHLLGDADAGTELQAPPLQPGWSAGDRLTLG